MAKQAGGCGEQMSSSARVQWYNSTTVRQGGCKVEPLFTISCTPAPGYARVLHPYACLRSGDIVTASLHGALYSPQPFVPPSGPAGSPFDPPRLAQITGIINIIMDRLVRTRAGEPRSTMPLLFCHRSLHSPSMTTPPSNAPCRCLQDAACLSCAPCPVHSHSPSKPLDASSHPISHALDQTASLTSHNPSPLRFSALPPALFLPSPLPAPPLCLSVRFALLRSRIATECEMLARIAFPNLHPT